MINIFIFVNLNSNSLFLFYLNLNSIESNQIKIEIQILSRHNFTSTTIHPLRRHKNPFMLVLGALLLNLLGCGNAQGACTTSISRVNTTVAGPVSVDLNPLTPADNNRLSVLNETVHQEWYFEPFSSD